MAVGYRHPFTPIRGGSSVEARARAPQQARFKGSAPSGIGAVLEKLANEFNAGSVPPFVNVVP